MSQHLHRSRFMELLSGSSQPGNHHPRHDFAERLSTWLAPVDTIQLHGLLQNAPGGSHISALGSTQAVVTALNNATAKVRSQLTETIAASANTMHQQTHGFPPSYTPYRTRHLDLQRQMETNITALRSGVRQVLAKMSPTLKHLASLDAMLEHALSGREQKLMAAAPLLLERRFESMKTGAEHDAPTLPTDASTSTWQRLFDCEWQEHLMAELDLRLQPVMGLIEALGQSERAHA